MLSLSISLMVLDHNWARFAKIRYVLNASVSPIEYVVDWPVELIGTVANNLTTHQDLIEENASLKMQLLLLQSQIQKLVAMEKENSQLRELLSSSSKAGGAVAVAQVLAVDSDPYVQQVVLNRGAQDKIAIGQPVLDAQGVMGQVIEVNPWTSRVMLLSDPRSGIAINVVRNGLRAIAVGNGNSEQLKLINMPKTTDIQVGDVLVSSGLDLRYPIGYPVGIVTKLNYQKGAQYLTVDVKPSAYLNRSRLVLVVLSEDSTIATTAKQQLADMKSAGEQLRVQGGEAQHAS